MNTKSTLCTNLILCSVYKNLKTITIDRPSTIKPTAIANVLWQNFFHNNFYRFVNMWPSVVFYLGSSEFAGKNQDENSIPMNNNYR